tara:strand:+ start:451 stop:1329 length:879 start_codon:yes stop_codon:yes gene_type:complete
MNPMKPWRNTTLVPISKEKRLKRDEMGICRGLCNSMTIIQNNKYQVCPSCAHFLKYLGEVCEVPHCNNNGDGNTRMTTKYGHLLCGSCHSCYSKKCIGWDWERFVEYRANIIHRPVSYQKTDFPVVDNPVERHTIAECVKCKKTSPISVSQYQFCDSCRKQEQYAKETCWCCGNTTEEACGMGWDTPEGLFACNRCSLKKSKYKLASYSILKHQIRTRLVCDICKKPVKHEGRTQESACIDHDHTNNKVRGVLCPSCNFLDGYIKKNDCAQEWAKLYVGYVANPPLDIPGMH